MDRNGLQRHRRRWFASLSPEQLRSYAEQRGLPTAYGMEREGLVEFLLHLDHMSMLVDGVRVKVMAVGL